ncbi:MAG: hypothetical protein U5M50_02125 [Sphingobium sp.]|nr:hypothetical protein [Sphingobium sp.]
MTMSAPPADQVTLYAWASGMLEFCAGNAEPDGALRVCTVHGYGWISEIFDAVRDTSVLHDFGGGTVHLGIPDIVKTVGEDPVADVDALIEWADYLREDFEGIEEIEWERMA